METWPQEPFLDRVFFKNLPSSSLCRVTARNPFILALGIDLYTCLTAAYLCLEWHVLIFVILSSKKKKKNSPLCHIIFIPQGRGTLSKVLYNDWKCIKLQSISFFVCGIFRDANNCGTEDFIKNCLTGFFFSLYKSSEKVGFSKYWEIFFSFFFFHKESTPGNHCWGDCRDSLDDSHIYQLLFGRSTIPQILQTLVPIETFFCCHKYVTSISFTKIRWMHQWHKLSWWQMKTKDLMRKCRLKQLSLKNV